MQLVLIPADKLQSAWPHIAHLAEQIADGNRQQTPYRRAEDIASAVAKGEEWCWSVLDDSGNPIALILGCVTDFPLVRVMQIHACVGSDRRKWVHLLSEIEDYAKDNGCGVLQITPRKGWVRDLPEYRMTHVVLEKTL